MRKCPCGFTMCQRLMKAKVGELMHSQINKSVGSTAGIKRTGNRVCKHVAGGGGGSVSFKKL